jgi:hypothetical protein
LARLDDLLKEMLDLETFNELVDIVRQLIAEQERVLGDTQKTHDEIQKSLRRDLE